MIDNRNNNGQTTISFVDERDDQLYESMFGKKIYITEEQAKYIKHSLLNEEHLITKIIQSCSDNDEYIKNDFDEKWKRVPEDSDFFKKIKGLLTFDNNSKLALNTLAEVEDMDVDPYDDPDDKRYVGVIYGGLNGPGKWQDYLKDISTALSKVGGYLIDLDNDAPDDVWTLLFAFHENKVKLNEGASGYEPEDSDSYFDLCYELSEKIFEDLLKHIDKNLKVKNDNAIYTYLGIINHMLKVSELHAPLRYENKDLGKDERLGVKIIKKCIEGYNYLFSDKKENRQGWKDFEEYKRNLTIQYKIFKELMKMLNYDSDVDIVLTEPTHLRESKNFVEPQKVLVVKKFLDDNFVRAAIPTIGEDGYSKTLLIVGMKGTDGQVNRNMYAQQLFDLLQDKFKNIYLDKQKRDNFLKRVMKDWYDKKITKDGLLSVNIF